MIDISIKRNLSGLSDKKSFEEMSSVKGIVLHCRSDLFEYTLTKAFTEDSYSAGYNSKFYNNKGYHYAIDAEHIVKCVSEEYQTGHLGSGKNTFINNAAYGNKANEHTLSVIMLIPENQKYEDVERKTIKFIADLLIKRDLTPDNLMRAFDLNKSATPFHLLDKTKWRKFIATLTSTYDEMKKNGEKYTDDKLEQSETSFTDSEVRTFYLKNGDKPLDTFVKDFEPDHRDIEAIVNFKAGEVKVETFDTKNNTNFTYSVTENAPPSTDHCSRAFDTLTAKVAPNPLKVEPIYPDLAVPPGGTITLTNSITDNKSTLSNKVPLSVEEFENRDKAFNMKNHVDAVKKVEGKPINNNDPFPVDDKIKELESHSPKVKIDEVEMTLHDCNHPESIIGPAVAQNFAMIQDQILTLAKRTERRLVKLENILSTTTRNLFRTSSRMTINCVYYGGQSVYGKYKGIRCLHNDRINDGQCMTLDQCLSCTRYEPIAGQVYAILDETGSNVAQVLDDIQMSYSSMEDYIELTRTEELHEEKDFANLNIEATPPKSFEETFDEGFKMDWTPTTLETQRYNVAEYKTEGIEAIKPTLKKPNEGEIEDEFKEVVTVTEAYETLKYSSNDYKFESFGENYSGTVPSLSNGGALVRSKIVEYAEKGLKLCQEGKGRYTMNTGNPPNRKSHDDNNVNGIHYWDCSSFAEAAYKYAGINSIAGNTTTEYPICLPTTGGMIIPISEESKALPGDLVWFTTQSPKPSSQSDLISASIGQIGHVGIYVGDGKYIHASTDDNAPNEQLLKSPTKNYDSRIFAFGRPKELVEADKKAEELIANGLGFFDYDSHNFNADITARSNKNCAGDVAAAISNMNTYGYKDILVEVCKNKGLDPYLIFGLITTESLGDPTNRTGFYWGIMQTSRDITRASSNISDIKYDIELGCDHYLRGMSYLTKPRGENTALAIYTYNAGNGTVDEACDEYGSGAETVKAGDIAQYVANAAIRRFGQSKQDECTAYVAKIILRANLLRSKKALD